MPPTGARPSRAGQAVWGLYSEIQDLERLSDAGGPGQMEEEEPAAHPGHAGSGLGLQDRTCTSGPAWGPPDRPGRSLPAFSSICLSTWTTRALAEGLAALGGGVSRGGWGTLGFRKEMLR